MLSHLNIRNFTLIDELEIDFPRGFSVITGETGAGKSIIVGAISMVLGKRADAGQVKKGSHKCVVEANFSLSNDERKYLADIFIDNDIDDNQEECILRREINANGKSRAFINDTPVALTVLREICEHLIDIHSQHKNLMLGKEDFQLNVIDVVAKNKDLTEQFKLSFAAYKKARRELETMLAEVKENKDKEGYLRFQYEELSSAHLSKDEQPRLEEESTLMRHAEEIKGALYKATEYLDNETAGAISQIGAAMSQLEDVEEFCIKAKDLRTRVESCIIELKDISQEMARVADNVDFDSIRAQEIEERLDLIYSLEQKHHVDNTAELLSLLAMIDRQLSEMDNYDYIVTQLQRKVDTLMTECMEQAGKISETRKQAAKVVEEEMHSRLVSLGLPNARFKVVTDRATELGTNGLDKISFLFSSNSSSALQPVSQVASGGEISRVMLSLKDIMSNATGMPTIIFDEIDTGVSGRIAEKMANIMKNMGDNGRQVVCITHLPQIAVAGKTHYKVTKHESSDGVQTTMDILTPAERINEIAQMLSGSHVTEAAINNAKSLLGIDR